MEPPEREKIEKNLFQLVRNTTCNESFIACFKQSHVLSRDDMETLQATNKYYGNIKCSMEFYEMIQTRKGAYNVLIEALRKTNQSGALDELENQQIGAKLARPTNYVHPPKYMEQFENDSNLTLIVCTPDTTITCNRIIETVPSIQKFDNPECFVQHTGSQSNTPMIMCGNDFTYFKLILSCREKKILVVSHDKAEEIKEIVNSTKSANITYEDDELTWDDLSLNMKKSIIDSLRQFGFSDECCDDMSNASTKLLCELIAGKHPSIFKNTIDDSLKYYVPRRLITRNIISSDVFHLNGEDLILVKGVEQIELIQLANGSETETSSNMLRSFNNQVKFVVLEHDSDFERILAKVGNEIAVHVVEYYQEKLVWRRSSAGINTMQQSVDISQYVLGEDDFFEKVLENSGKDPICISDSPGMGKSILLMQLARKLQERAKPSEVIGVVVITELIECILVDNGQSLGERISLALQQHFCDNDFAKAYFTNRKSALTNLLLDAFDELPEESLKLGYQVLHHIRTTFPDTKIWVTTRPHLLLDLEMHLNVLGFNIQAFDEEDQINFLKLFWCRDEQQIIKEPQKLTDFAKHCLSCLKSQLDHANDIAGIPLQCLLIGEVFEEDALRYYSGNIVEISTSVINSLTDLYTTLIEKKLKTFHDHYNSSELDDLFLYREHTYLSICLIFPRFKKQFGTEQKCSNKQLTIRTIFNVGILESETIIPAPRLIHRTFAEYFIAKYVSDNLHANCSDVLLNLLFKHILRTKTVKLKINKAVLNTHEFVNNVICYFIDSLMAKFDGKNLGDRYKKYILKIDLRKWKQFCHACAYGSFPNIFCLLISGISNFEKEIFTDEFVVLSTLRSEANMVQDIYGKFETISKTKLENIEFQRYSLIHFAVMRGNFQIFEKLRGMDYFKKILPTSDSSTIKSLIYDCVANTKQTSSSILQDKLKIITLFENMNKRCFDADLNSKSHPIFAPNIHLELARKIINFTDLRKINIDELLHDYTEWCSCDEFIRLIEILRSKEQTDTDRIKNALNSGIGGKSLLEKLLLMNPDASFFQSLKNFGQNAAIMATLPVFRAAEKRKIKKECFAWLFASIPEAERKYVLRRFNVQHYMTSLISLLRTNPTMATETFDSGDTLLHVMFADSVLDSYNMNLNTQLEGLKLLLSNGADITAQNNNFATPLDILMESSSVNCLSIWDFLLQQNKVIYEVSLYNKIKWATGNVKGFQFRDYDDIRQRVTGPNIAKDVKGNTLLHILAKWQHYETLKQLVLLGADVHALNTKNETPLYTLADRMDGCFESWKLFIEYGADVLVQKTNGRAPLNAIQFGNTKSFSMFLIYAMNHEFRLRSPKVEEILLAALKYGGSECIKMCEWYIENVGKPLKCIKCRYKGNRPTVLDAVLTSRNSELLGDVVETHGCTHSLQQHNKTWFYRSLENSYNKEKFFTIVNELFPDLIHAADEHGIVPLSYKYIHPDVVKELVRLGANVNASDRNGNTPLHHALMYDKWSVKDAVKALVDCGADVNASNQNKETPLLLAVKLFRQDDILVCINILVKAGADVRKTDASNNTILHLVPPKVDPENFHDIVKTMLTNGHSDVFHLHGENNLTPLQIATRHFKLESKTVSLLEEHGIKLE